MNKQLNTQLSDQLRKLVAAGEVKIKYPDGYHAWKQKFDYFYNITKDVNQTLNIIYGPEGGVKDYKGSIYHNANVVINKTVAKKEQKPKIEPRKHRSGSLKYIQLKKKP